MNRNATLTAVLMLLLTAVAMPAFADDAGELQQLRTENAQLKARVAELEKQLAEARQQTHQLTVEKKQIVEKQEQSAAEQREYYIDRDVDAASGKTLLVSRVRLLETPDGGFLRRHWVNFSAELNGKAAPAYIDVNLQTYATGTKLRDVKEITFTVAGKTIAAPVTDYDSQLRYVGTVGHHRSRADDETITAHLSLADARTVAAASEVTGHMAQTDFKLARDHINMLRAMLGEIDAK